MVSDDLQELLGGSRALSAKLVDQRFAGDPEQERSEDVGFRDVRNDIELLGEAPDVLAEGLSRLLPALLEVVGVPRAFIRALKVPHEDLPQIRPIVDPVWREVFKPSTSRVGQVHWEVPDDESVALRSACVAGQTIVVEPKAGVRFPGVLGDVRRRRENWDFIIVKSGLRPFAIPQMGFAGLPLSNVANMLECHLRRFELKFNGF